MRTIYQPTIEEVNEWSVNKINRYLRSIDESHKWPICGRFNATDRAIRRVQKLRREGLDIEGGYEYLLTVESEITRIVNDPKL